MFVGPLLNFVCSALSFTYVAEGDRGGRYCANCNGGVLPGDSFVWFVGREALSWGLRKVTG